MGEIVSVVLEQLHYYDISNKRPDSVYQEKLNVNTRRHHVVRRTDSEACREATKQLRNEERERETDIKEKSVRRNV